MVLLRIRFSGRGVTIMSMFKRVECKADCNMKNCRCAEDNERPVCKCTLKKYGVGNQTVFMGGSLMTKDALDSYFMR